MQTSYDNGTNGTIRDRDNNWPIGGRKKKPRRRHATRKHSIIRMNEYREKRGQGKNEYRERMSTGKEWKQGKNEDRERMSTGT